jgi:hypothetical protein
MAATVPGLGKGLLAFSGARERKDEIVGTIAEPRKRHTMGGDSENTLRESMGIVCASQSLIGELPLYGVLGSSQHTPTRHSGK